MVDIDFVRALRSDWMQRSVNISVLRGGLSNENFLVEDGRKLYKVRIPGRNTDFFSDRNGEINDLRILESTDLIWKPGDSNPKGVIPGVIDYKNDSKIAIFAYIPGVTARKEDFKRPEIRERFFGTVKRLNECGVELCRKYNIFNEVDKYMKRIRTCGDEIIRDYPIERLLRFKETIRNETRKDPLPPLPCHNDFVPDNIILCDHSAALIDWEYGGMADPRHEIADFFVEQAEPSDSPCPMSEKEEDHVLEIVFGKEKGRHKRIVDCYKFTSNLQWALWSVIQFHISEIDFDFEPYGHGFFEAALEVVEMLEQRYSLLF
jgi:thiamine kinase-like enzyme